MVNEDSDALEKKYHTNKSIVLKGNQGFNMSGVSLMHL